MWKGTLVDSVPQNLRSLQDALERSGYSPGSVLMSEPLPHLIEKSIQIAWDYLERTGEIADADEASRFLLRSVDQMAG
jgi:phosphoglycolate phosphatase-like HAD superfamily hydrolase